MKSEREFFENQIGKLPPADHIEEDFSGRYPYFRLLVTMLVERFHPQSALDIMCGLGNLVYAFRQAGVEAYGADISAWAISHTTEDIRRYLRKVDCERDILPFEDNSFDLATCHEGMEHLYTPAHIIAEIRRVLKPGGVMFAAIPTPPFDTRLWRVLSQNRTHVSLHSKRVWIKMFEKRGFEYIGDCRELVRQGILLRGCSFWLGRFLMRLGPLGRWFWLKLAPHVRGTFLFKVIK